MRTENESSDHSAKLERSATIELIIIFFDILFANFEISVNNVFDTMSHVKLIHDMKKEKFRAESSIELAVFCSIVSRFSQ
jgi:hypothetical protein